jgi:hypothetical protein
MHQGPLKQAVFQPSSLDPTGGKVIYGYYGAFAHSALLTHHFIKETTLSTYTLHLLYFYLLQIYLNLCSITHKYIINLSDMQHASFFFFQGGLDTRKSTLYILYVPQ